ncbi:MerR family transcriptional regulator [Svornostia abyssi]|uniref:MerR family transcriptional regulator n=1 Tax=Svornostia abyssi TaxID=2898438 RepID=A0ABY5PDG9_9ACTN|nr:MerR family transcriptional regulator [Parviterribacteraceae bacterium J379]
MPPVDEYTVGTVARMSGVSARTLHHYDEIGLLPASGRSESGYRLYTDADLERLRRILFYRELEFGLEEIARILEDPEAGDDDHLRRQHRMLRERQARTAGLLHALEQEMEARQMGIKLTPEEQFEIFGTDKLEEHQQEAEQRWGDTDAWKESQRRTAAYTKDDWVQIKAEADTNIEAFAAAIEAGEPADGPVARALAEDHRQHISRWFYECGYDMHRNLAALYVSDPRFTKTWGGIAQYVHHAILANAAGR